MNCSYLELNNKMRSGREILIDGLIGHGTSHIFCVPGESYLPALDALYDKQELVQLITCRQEGGAAYMAEAQGKLTGQPGICFVSRGPGASNAMIGIHAAFQDSTPLLLLIGQVARAESGREAFQEPDYRQVYGSVAKKVVRFNDTARIPELLGYAWRYATAGRPEPVVIELPEDILHNKAAVTNLPPTVVERPAPTTLTMSTIGELLESAKHPVLLVGGAGWTSKATAALRRFAEKQQLPVVTAFRRSDSFDNTHPLYIGELGIGPNSELVKCVQSSDLLIAVAPRLGDMTTTGYTSLIPPDRSNCNPQQKLVHVHIDAQEIGRVFAADLGIASCPHAFLDATGVLPPTQSDRAEYLYQGRKMYLDWLHMPRNLQSDVRMDIIMSYLREKLPANTVITVGAGNFSAWGQRNYQFRHFGTFLGSTNGSMGYGVPSAISAKLMKPESIVISFSGDGCFMMNGQELATAVQYKLNVIFLVVNNSRYGTIRTHQEQHYPGRVSGTALRNPDFISLARAYGAYAEKVDKTDQFEQAFENALKANLPALIELIVD